MTESLKNFIPPFFLDKLQYMKAYLKFYQYKNLVKQNHIYKDIHKGKRCFILGSGKSIDKENLMLLKDEILIGVNSFVHHPNFSEIFNADVTKYFLSAPIHGPYSEDHWKKHLIELEEKISKDVTNIFGISNYHPSIKDINDKYDIFKDRHIIWFFSNIVNDSTVYRSQLKDLDLTSNIWSASTGSILALICALYMGFDEIYLLGMDHDYFLHKNGEGRFEGIDQSSTLLIEEKEYIQKLNQTDSKFYQPSNLKVEFKSLSEIFDQYHRLNNLHPNKIFNLGKNSLLDIFPFKDMEEVMNK